MILIVKLIMYTFEYVEVKVKSTNETILYRGGKQNLIHGTPVECTSIGRFLVLVHLGNYKKKHFLKLEAA